VNPLRQDTSPEQIERYFRLLRDMTPAQRLRASAAATRRMRLFAEAGVRKRHPGADEATVRREMIRLLYGHDAVHRLCGCE
jgi:hypothetical protein